MLEDAKEEVGGSEDPRRMGLGACSMTGVRIAGTAPGGVSVIPSPRKGAAWSAATSVVVGEVNQWGDHAVCSRGS